jgi:hypothetical protein
MLHRNTESRWKPLKSVNNRDLSSVMRLIHGCFQLGEDDANPASTKHFA